MARYGLGTQIRASIPMIKALRREIMIVLIVFLVGLLVGWLLFGWVIAPVEWTDAAPVDLQDAYRDYHLRLLAIAYNSGAVTAQELQALGIGERWSYAEVVARLTALATPAGNVDYRRLIDAVTFLQTQQGGAGATPGAASGLGLRDIVLLLGLLLVGAAVVFFAYQVVRRRAGVPATGAAPGAPRTAARAQASRTSEPTAWPGEIEPPLRQFDMTYVLGDDRFDMSNAIETPGGMFLGECGMGISETIGVGDPSKVTAFEVWLFDKNDIRTVTAVLMSEHAYRDLTLKAKLAAKGDAVSAQPNAVITLETASLRVRAKVVELEYGAGQLPEKSFFQRLHVVMAAWTTGDGGVTQPAEAMQAG